MIEKVFNNVMKYRDGDVTIVRYEEVTGERKVVTYIISDGTCDIHLTQLGMCRLADLMDAMEAMLPDHEF